MKRTSRRPRSLDGMSLSIVRKSPPDSFIARMEREGDPLELADLLGEDEVVLTAQAGRRAVGVARLSFPFGSDVCHLSISDVYVLHDDRGRGVYGALLLASIRTPEAAQTLACGGPIYMVPIHGTWQEQHAQSLGFRRVSIVEDVRRWPFLDDTVQGPYPVMVYEPSILKNRRTSKRTSRPKR